MEPTQTQKSNTFVKDKDEDIDLGLVFHKTGGLINSFFQGIGRFFSLLGQGLLLCLFFLRRNLVWLLLGTAVGLGYGLFLLSKNGTKYFSDMTVQTNFNSTRSLYGSIDFINALINSSRTQELARIFKISPDEAKTLVSFEANPVQGEMIIADMYRDQFLTYNRNNRLRSDTFWVRTIQYKDFKASLTKFDYPLHNITVTSTSAEVFANIEKGLIEQVSRNELLQQIRTNKMQNSKEEEALITSSIQSLDTLRSTYNKRLSMGAGKGESGGNSLTLVDGTAPIRTPELELYDKLLELKDELRAVKDKSVIENKIIQVYSPFSAVGQKASFFRQSVVRYGIFGFCIAFILLLGIASYKLLASLEKQRSGKQQSARLSNDL